MIFDLHIPLFVIFQLGLWIVFLAAVGIGIYVLTLNTIAFLRGEHVGLDAPDATFYDEFYGDQYECADFEEFDEDHRRL